MKAEAIITAAGMGTRLGGGTPKALMMLGKEPLFLYSLKIFAANSKISAIVLTVPKGYEEKFRKYILKSGMKKPVKVVVGGKSRSASVRNGLAALAPKTDAVLIHDAARPFVKSLMIDAVIAALKKVPAATVAVPVKPTIKRVDPKTGYVEATLDRRFLWDIQTPQGFRKTVILRAHEKGEDATDDAFLVEQLGERVKVVVGDYRNIKITTPEDMIFACAFLKVK